MILRCADFPFDLPSLQCSDLTFNLTASAEQCNPFSKSNLIKKTANHVFCEKFCAGSSFKERKVTQVNAKDHLTKGFIRFIISASVVKMHRRLDSELRSRNVHQETQLRTKGWHCATGVGISFDFLSKKCAKVRFSRTSASQVPQLPSEARGLGNLPLTLKPTHLRDGATAAMCQQKSWGYRARLWKIWKRMPK